MKTQISSKTEIWNFSNSKEIDLTYRKEDEFNTLLIGIINFMIDLYMFD